MFFERKIKKNIIIIMTKKFLLFLKKNKIFIIYKIINIYLTKILEIFVEQNIF